MNVHVIYTHATSRIPQIYIYVPVHTHVMMYMYMYMYTLVLDVAFLHVSCG